MANHHLGNGFFGGWIPDRPDHRDHEFLPTVAAQAVPEAWEFPGIAKIPLLNQGQQGSCTGHGSANALMCDQSKQGQAIVIPSRAMLYYDARIPEGTTGYDSGAYVRDAVKGAAKYGACPDAEFPYNDQVCNVAPSAQDYADAKQQEALKYEQVKYGQLNAANASGYVIVFGFTVYASFMTGAVARTGIVPMPGKNDSTVGGHCVIRFGFNRTDAPWTAPSGLVYPAHTVACRNQWVNANGTPWGAKGNFFLPQAYFDAGLTSDHWVVQQTGPQATP